MQIEMKDPAEVWRSRGRPARPIPPIVADAAEASYRSGKCGTVTVEPGEEAEAKELMSLLKAYAKRQGKGMRFQREGDTLVFRMYKIRRVTPKEKVSA